jgi:hypothetical protein
MEIILKIKKVNFTQPCFVFQKKKVERQKNVICNKKRSINFSVKKHGNHHLIQHLKELFICMYTLC